METALINKENDKITISERAVIDRLALSRIKEYVGSMLPAGHILLVYRAGNAYGADLRHSLRKSGYRVTEMPLKKEEYSSRLSDNPIVKDESVRLIIGTGGGREKNAASYLSRLMHQPNMFFLTEPTSDTLFSPWGHLGKELVYLSCTPASHIIADTSTLPDRTAIAEGMGILYARLIGTFDRKYSLRVSGSFEGRDKGEKISSLIMNFFNSPFNPSSIEDNIRLTECLIRVSLLVAEDEAPPSAQELLSLLIEVRCGRCPAAPLIAAHTLFNLYLFWLDTPTPDFMLPPDRSNYIDRLYGDRSSCYAEIKEWERDDYFRISYVTEEIRDRLRDELSALTPSPSEIVMKIKEVFPDSGYHIKDVTHFKELMGLTALTAELSEEISLLKFIDRTGVLWHYVRDLE